MAIVTIQHRRGEYADYDPSKVLPGELVVTQTGDPNTTDGEAAYIATRAGSVKRIPFASEVEDLKTEMDDVVEEAREAIESAIDPTLTQSGKAADAKKTGDEISGIKSDISQLEPGLSAEAKAALLACFENVVWKNTNGSQLYDMLESALYAEDYPRITAIFNPDTNKIYTDDTLETLKQYLTVTYYEAEGSAGVAVPSNEYVLTGRTLTEGTNTVVVTYQRYTTAFNVTAIDFYNIWTWSMGDSRLQKVVGSVDINQSDTTKYPSKAFIRTDVTTRRNFNTSRGILPYYSYNQTAVSSGFYPIPVPKDANHMKITLTPSTQYIFAQVFAYNSSNNTYDNSYSQNRIKWANGLGGGEIDIARPNGETSMFLCINTKYDNAGTSYPSEPTGLTIEFSEV